MSPLARRLIALYTILAIALFCFPGGMVGWIDDRNASGWLDAPLSVARGVDAASKAVGLKAVGQKLRAGFRGLVGGDQG